MPVGKIQNQTFGGLRRTTEKTTKVTIGPTSTEEDKIILEDLRNLKVSDIMENGADCDHRCMYLPNLGELEFSIKPTAHSDVLPIDCRYEMTPDWLMKKTVTHFAQSTLETETEVAGKQVKPVFEYLVELTKKIAKRG